MNKKQQLITKFLKKNNNETSTNKEIINNEPTQNKKIINTEIIDFEIIDDYIDKHIKQNNINIDNEEQFINRCVLCNIDIGFCNPRQYCGKSYCKNTTF